MNGKLLLSCVVVALLMGCAGENAMRTTASISASMLNDYRKGLENYVQVENEILSATEARVNDLASDQQFIAGNVNVRITAWKVVKNDAALNLYNALTVVPPETILATSPELRTLQPVASAPQIKVDTKQFDTVVKTLNTLAKQPGFSDRVSFLVKYGSAVSAAYKSSMDKAAMQAKDTQGKAQSPAANPNKQP